MNRDRPDFIEGVHHAVDMSALAPQTVKDSLSRARASLETAERDVEESLRFWRDEVDRLRGEPDRLTAQHGKDVRRLHDLRMDAEIEAREARAWAVAAMERCAALEEVIDRVVREAFDAGVRWQSTPGERLSTRARREGEAIGRARATLNGEKP